MKSEYIPAKLKVNIIDEEQIPLGEHFTLHVHKTRSATGITKIILRLWNETLQQYDQRLFLDVYEARSLLKALHRMLENEKGGRSDGYKGNS